MTFQEIGQDVINILIKGKSFIDMLDSFALTVEQKEEVVIKALDFVKPFVGFYPPLQTAIDLIEEYVPEGIVVGKNVLDKISLILGEIVNAQNSGKENIEKLDQVVEVVKNNVEVADASFKSLISNLYQRIKKAI